MASMGRFSGLCLFPSSSALLLVILPSTKSDQSPLLFSPPFHLYSPSVITTAFVGVSALLFWDFGLSIKPLCTFLWITWSTHSSKPPLSPSCQNCLAAPDLFPSILFHLYWFFFFLTSSMRCFAGTLTWTWLNHNPLQSHQWIEL